MFKLNRVTPLASLIFQALILAAAPSTLAVKAYEGYEQTNTAPSGSKDAFCQYGEGREFCRVKVDSARNSITIWTPLTRESPKAFTYKGSWLEKGCVLIGPDFGYPTRAKYRLIYISSKKILWLELGGNKLRQTIEFM